MALAPTAMRDMNERRMPEMRKWSLDAPDEALPLEDDGDHGPPVLGVEPRHRAHRADRLRATRTPGLVDAHPVQVDSQGGWVAVAPGLVALGRGDPQLGGHAAAVTLAAGWNRRCGPPLLTNSGLPAGCRTRDRLSPHRYEDGRRLCAAGVTQDSARSRGFRVWSGGSGARWSPCRTWPVPRPDPGGRAVVQRRLDHKDYPDADDQRGHPARRGSRDAQEDARNDQSHARHGSCRAIRRRQLST